MEIQTLNLEKKDLQTYQEEILKKMIEQDKSNQTREDEFDELLDDYNELVSTYNALIQ